MRDLPRPLAFADLDLCGRIALTHRLAPELLARALRLDSVSVAAIIAGTRTDVDLDGTQRERVPLVANVLVRLEIRFAHDSSAIRAVLDRPLDRLDGSTIAVELGADVAMLRRLREVIDDLNSIPVRWWRVGH